MKADLSDALCYTDLEHKGSKGRMQLFLNWIINNPWLVVLSALGSIASIWGLFLAFGGKSKSQKVQTVHARGSIRRSPVSSTGSTSTDQQVTADKDIVDSAVTHSSVKSD